MIKRTIVDGPVLATLREEADLRQVDLAELAGCSQPYLSKLENYREVASLTLVERFADVLSDRLGRTITAEVLTSSNVCPTCRSPLAQTA